ncbi:voltage-gated hydrogen channel 1-like isoform X1 [Haliotis rufescens]|uniref:voltage-gated hydrogen channel 1-like isoform X1 n=1 Tax=Haliotis rufescens TaxID=6454 RepID=UPI00201EBF6E|nr:voltage-gated hydrogen channel 1-like isoform X1 [Haliotis rufescens]
MDEKEQSGKVQMDGFHKLQDDLEKVIEKDDSGSSVTDSDEVSRSEPRTTREKIHHLLHTNKFQIGVICLVILDCFLVIIELLLDLRVFELPDHENHVAPKILHYMSLAILSVFMVEIGVRLYAMRLDFFKHKLELFDAVVVIVSFILDIIYRNAEGAANGIGLLIVLRLWRVTRVLNGIVMSVKRQSEKRLERERRLRTACEQELAKYRQYCSSQEREIELLQGILRKHGIEYIEKSQKPPTVSTIDVVAEVNQSSDKTSDDAKGDRHDKDGDKTNDIGT